MWTDGRLLHRLIRAVCFPLCPHKGGQEGSTVQQRRRTGQAQVRFTVISLGRRDSGRWRTALKHGAVIASALFYAYAILVFSGIREHVVQTPFECGVPALTLVEAEGQHRFSGTVAAEELPWSARPPEPLTTLWNLIGTDKLVSAFRITLPNPLWDERQNVANAAHLLAGTIIAPGETVSVIHLTGPYTRDRGYGDGPGYSNGRLVPVAAGGVCKIGTAVYNTAIYGGLTVVERHPHSMIVPYVQPGRDAAIATGFKDVRVRNDYEHPMLLWADMKDTTLFIALYGQAEAPRVQWHHEEVSRQTAPLNRTPNHDLPAGEERIVFTGYDGMTVRTWLTIERPNQPPERLELSTDTYRPLAGRIEYGP